MLLILLTLLLFCICAAARGNKMRHPGNEVRIKTNAKKEVKKIIKKGLLPGLQFILPGSMCILPGSLCILLCLFFVLLFSNFIVFYE